MVLWGVCHSCEFDFVFYGYQLYGVGFQTCVVKFQDVVCEVFVILLVLWGGGGSLIVGVYY